tara:strand:- start:20 stop:517 length:498 start_codon:yes stop_codon:yes gene_type:complete
MAKYIATEEDANSQVGSYITETGTYEFKTTNVIHKINQRDGTDLFECTFATKDGSTMRKTFYWGDLSKPTSEYKARILIFMYLKACGIKIFRDELDSEDAVGFYNLVKDKKFDAKVVMTPDRNDPNKSWAEIGFSGFIHDSNYVLFKEGTSEKVTDVEEIIDQPW